MYETYGDRVRFVMVYVREAHPVPADQGAEEAGWKMIDDVVYHQPTSYEERRKLAETACTYWEIPFPALVDTLEPDTGSLYYAVPNRIYLLDKRGQIIFRGVRGAAGGAARPAEIALREFLGLPDGDYVSEEFQQPAGRGRGTEQGPPPAGSAGGRRGARQDAPTPQQMLERMDLNGDGKLQKDELPEQRAQRLLERFDANGDGIIDREELESPASSL
jgi:hypothetical protein